MSRYYLFNDEQPSTDPIGGYETLLDAYNAGYSAPAFSNDFHLSIINGQGVYQEIAERDSIDVMVEGVGTVNFTGWRLKDGTFIMCDERY